MPKIVVIGSCKYSPYEILIVPNTLDTKLYVEDHEKAYEEACKKFYPAIDKADEVWVYVPNGIIGEHTQRDIDYAQSKRKTIRIIGKGDE
jgi:hypothetical protein